MEVWAGHLWKFVCYFPSRMLSVWKFDGSLVEVCKA